MAAMAIGVDFGTVNIRVGRWVDGRFEGITDKSGADTIPAFFARKNGREFFGQEGWDMLAADPTKVISDVTNLVRRNLSEVWDQVELGMYPFKSFDLPDHREFDFQLYDGSTVSPIKIIQCFLQQLHMQCEKLFGLQDFSLAFNVPSYWKKSIRQYNSTKLLDAARCSGFTRVSLIDSQVAATLGCYLSMKNSKSWLKDILVVDVGATDITATVSRTHLEEGTETETFMVTGISLGCTSVDQALMRYLKNQFIIAHRLPLETIIDMTSWHRLRMECEKARICLSSALTTVLFVPNFAVGYDLHVELTRDTFDDVVGSTIADDVVGITEEVLTLSKINVELSTKDDFRLFLVGGGSRIPCIQQRMTLVFGRTISSAVLQHCEDASVIGAAGYARMIALEPDIMELDTVQHYRDLCDFFENYGTFSNKYSTARLARCRSACTYTSARRTLVYFNRMASIIPSMHSISAKTDRVSYRFSIKCEQYHGDYFSNWNVIGPLRKVELIQATAAFLQLQKRHMSILSSEGTLKQEDLTSTDSFGKFKGRMNTTRNPLDLCHPNVVRCLAVERTAPMRDHQDRDELSLTWPLEEKFTHMLLEPNCFWLRPILKFLFQDHSIQRSFSSSGLDITLHRFCKQRDSSLGNKEIINKTKQLLDGLSYLHNREIPLILASLTSSGILVTADGETVKIWDILFCLRDKSPSKLKFDLPTYFSTKKLAYAHPDVSNYIFGVSLDHEMCSTLNFEPYLDIWSIGCVVLDMASRGHHFICIDKRGALLDNRIRMQDFVRAMAKGGVPLISSSAPDVIRQICTKCFERKVDRQTDIVGLLTMISQIPENKIDVCSRDKASPMFAVSKNLFFEFSKVSDLGGGSYGCVYGVDVSKNRVAESSIYNNIPEVVNSGWRNDEKLALKILFNYELPESKQNQLMRLSHDHVVKYISFGTLSMVPGNTDYKHPSSAILMEYYEGGDLNELARQQELSAAEIVNYTRQIVSGLAYLHGNDGEDYLLPSKKFIIHGDLKGKNIFLTSERRGTVKIGDIDSSARLLQMGSTDISGLRTKEGTLMHMSPELLAHAFGNETESVPTHIGRATDIWSLGCIILEMFNGGEVSYSEQNRSELATGREFAKSVSLGAHPNLSVADAKDIQPGFRQLLQNCLLRKPRSRPRASDLFSALVRLQ